MPTATPRPLLRPRLRLWPRLRPPRAGRSCLALAATALAVLPGCTGFARDGGPGLPYAARGEPAGGLQARARLLNGQEVDGRPRRDAGDPTAMVVAFDLRSIGGSPGRVPAGLREGEGSLILTAVAGERSRTRVVPLDPTSDAAGRGGAGRGGAGGDLVDLPPSDGSPEAGWREFGTRTLDAERLTGLDLARGDLVTVVFAYDHRPADPAPGEWTGRAYSGPVVMRVR